MSLPDPSTPSPLHVGGPSAHGAADVPSQGSEAPSASEVVLDSPVWSSLTGAHRDLAIGNEHVLRYPQDVSPFVGVRDWEHPDVWDAILDVFGHDAVVSVSHADPMLPEGWRPEFEIPGVQLVQTERLSPRPEPGAVELGAADSEEMLTLIALTRPGPFEARTHEMGRYVGIRRGGELIAMAGERLHPAGWTEISAVAVHPEHRRQGLLPPRARRRLPHPGPRGPGPPARLRREHLRDRRLREARLRAAAPPHLRRGAHALSRVGPGKGQDL